MRGTDMALTRPFQTTKHYPHPSVVLKDAEMHPKALEGMIVGIADCPVRTEAPPTTFPEGPIGIATELAVRWGVNAFVVPFNGYRPEISELQAYELLKEHFRIHGIPDVFGISGIITTRNWQRSIARMVRALAPDTFLVTGGGLSTEEEERMFYWIPEIDAVASGEGIEVIRKICLDAKLIKSVGWESAVNSGNLAPYYLGHDGNRHRFHYVGKQPKNLDEFPIPDPRLLQKDMLGLGNPLQLYLDTPVWGTNSKGVDARNSSATLVTIDGNSSTFTFTWGCPYNCGHCFRTGADMRLWGMHSPEYLGNAIRFHQEVLGSKFIGAVDDNGLLNKEACKARVPYLKPLQIKWGIHGRMNELADLDILLPTIEAGCIYVGAGPESGHPRILKEVIDKGASTFKLGLENVTVSGQVYTFPRTMTEAVRNSIEYGMHVNCTWIMGLPTEGLPELKQTVAFIKWQTEQYERAGLPATSVNKRMFTLTWYPGIGIIKHQKVRNELTRVFGITFEQSVNLTAPFKPIADSAYDKYLGELGDATKVLYGNDDEPLNFGDMPTDVFLKARRCVDDDRLFDILEM
jgi:radical SAM superfamily enzyme YgiQ (UPF0313 family)